ncbi:MAG: tRNA-dihydrouridine synthase [Thermoplasmata archaeon]|jgi:nifR3 family TIM-barrel protein|nr:tRNA-dihydrouridine synthase [Thermoplasmata archaeon]
MTIGGTDRKWPLVLSPMVDVTDAAFRSIAAESGADVTCSEMVAAIGLMHDSPGAWKHLEPWPGERPYGVQFMCAEPAEMTAAIERLATRITPDFVDVNLGCPAPNILRSCAGGFLMRDPAKAGAVLSAARKAADEAGIKLVSAKMRLGPSATRHTYVEVGKVAQDAGIDWVTLHARTVEQGYQGDAEWPHIGRLVAALDIPVVGNGDLRTPADVVRMRDETDCAGFFIARAAMHDPTVFARMRAALDGRDVGPAPDLAARMATLVQYLERAERLGIGIGDLRRQATRLVAGAPGAKRLRVAMQSAPDAAALRERVAEALVQSPAS